MRAVLDESLLASFELVVLLKRDDTFMYKVLKILLKKSFIEVTTTRLF